MTRINTNVASLVGRNALGRSNSSLNEALTRLSTGLRINTGKDDPAGLIASENLRSDITSIRKAISNTDRATQVIATADSALGQVSSLLNDIRGLVTESANEGALSDEQIAANQLQLDSSLEALNRIAQTTTFQGRRLLDGSLDFTTTAEAEFGKLSNLQIDQANLGAEGSVDVDINVTAAATQASLDITNITADVAPVNSAGTLTFGDSAVGASGEAVFERQTAAAQAGSGTIGLSIETVDSTESTGTITLPGVSESTATGTFTLNNNGSSVALATVTVDPSDVGTDGNGITLVLNAGAGTDAFDSGSNELRIFNVTAGSTTVDDVETAINAVTGFSVTPSSDATTIHADDIGAPPVNAITGTTSGGIEAASSESFTLTAANGEGIDGALGDGITVRLSSDGSFGASFSGGVVTVGGVVAGTTTVAQIESEINGLDEVVVSGASGSTRTIAAAEVSSGTGVAATGTTAGGNNATAVARTLVIDSVAGAGNDFNIAIDATLAASSISDADATDSIVAGITGNATTGYTIQIASDQATDLNNLAQFIQNNIAEAATVTYSGTGGEEIDPTRGAEVVPTVGSPSSVTGSQAATVATETIGISVADSVGLNGNLSINFTQSQISNGTDTTALIDNGNNSYTVVIDTDAATVDFTDIRDELNNITGVTATYGGTSAFDTVADTASEANTVLTGGRDAGDDVITITAATAGAEFDGNVSFNTGNSTIGGIDVTVTDGDITVSVDSTSSYNIADIAAAISDLTDYNASVTTSNGSGTFDNNDTDDNTTPVAVGLTAGQAATGGIAADAVIELAGINGSEVFNLRAGTGVDDLIKQINLVSDATGVSASQSGTTLQLRSTEYGTNSLVDLQIKQEADGGTFGAAVGEGTRTTGTDIVATVNGVAANGDGNSLSINTATLDLSTTVEADFIGTVEFDITGGGALFQLGPDVVSNQQARLGISSVNTAALGGTSGNLFQLQSGGSADLTSDTTTAARVVEEAIDQITGLRGRLGAFQRTTLETNKNALNDTLVNLTEAESSIRDADFAVESAKLTRAQILVQSGTNVLGIANQNPQNVLSLLR